MAWHFALTSYSPRPTRYCPHRVLLALIVTTSYSLSSLPPASSLTSYSSLCILQLPGVSVTLRAALTMSQSSLSYLPCPTHYCPHCVLLALIVATSYSLSSSPCLTRSHSRHVLLAIVLAAGVLIDIVLVTVYSTTSQCLCHSESYANHVTRLAIILAASYSLSSLPRLTRSHSRHILLAIVLATGILIAILLIAILLIASCRICQLSFVSDTQSNDMRVKTALLHVMIAAMGVTLGAFAGNAKCVVAYIDVHTVDIKNRTGLSHYAWNPLCVCECDTSICCDVPCLDSQPDCAAMTRRVQ